MRTSILALALAAVGFPGLPQDQPGKRTVLAIGEPRKVSLTPQDNLDTLRGTHCREFELPCEAGKVYVIDVESRSKDFDPYLRLKDDQGKQLAADDDGGEGWNARIIFPCTKQGTYTVIATTYAGDLGDFVLTVRHPQTLVNKAFVHRGAFSKEDMNDGLGRLAQSYPVRLEGGKTYIIEMTSQDDNLKPALMLKNARGLVRRGDGVLSAHIRFSCLETETYVVVPMTSSPGAAGNFQVTITPVE